MADTVPIAGGLDPNRPAQNEGEEHRWNGGDIPSPEVNGDFVIPSQKKKLNKWRHTLGIILLLSTVFLWTASNFLASVYEPPPWPKF